MQRTSLHAVIVVCIGGLLFGSQQGYPSLAVEVTRSLSDCTRYHDAKTCDAFSAVCWWNATVSSCGYRDQVTPCSGATTRDGCAALPHCTMRNRRCVHAEAWSAHQRSSFIASGVLGSLISGLCTGAVLGFVTHPTVLGVAGLISSVAAVLLMVSWETPDTERHQLSMYAGLLTGRVMLGVSNGMLSAAPLYGGTAAAKDKRDCVIITFEAFAPAAGFVFAVIVYLNDKYSSPPVQYEAFHALHGILCAAALVLVLISFIIVPIDPNILSADMSGSDETPLLEKAHAVHVSTVDDDRYLSLWKPCAAGCLLVMFVQCSGAHVIMNFAPTLSVSMGLAPLAGTVVLLGGNLVASAAALFLRNAGMRPSMMLQAGLIGSVLLSGITAAAFWFADEDASSPAQLMMMISLLGKLTVYRLFLTPSLAVLVQRLFTRPWRALGTSVISAFNSCCTILMLWTYPIVTESLSDEGNEEGSCYVFALFALISAVGVPLCYHIFKDTS